VSEDYDRVKLRAAMAVALEPFISPNVIDSGKDAVIDLVTAASIDMLRLICGSPSAERPRGLLRKEDIIACP
jgi:hypothetical protein